MNRRLLSLICTLGLLLTACAAEPADPALSFAPVEENRLTVYTSHKEEVYRPIIKEFEERTGIWVEIVTGGTNELLEQIAAERESPHCDIMFGGGAESLRLYEDCFAPYTCADAELLKSELRQEGDIWTPFSSLPIVLIYNTRLVAPEELTGWEDLLSGQWRGKIAFADPAVSGSGYTAAITLMTALGGDFQNTLRRFLTELDGNILTDSGDVVAAVDEGTCSVGITLEETALKNLARGADIGIVYPVEGTSCLPDGIALIQNAPHSENAGLFLEFVQSAHVQTRVVSDLYRRTVRTDVADRNLEAFSVLNYDIEWASQNKEDFLARWREEVAE